MCYGNETDIRTALLCVADVGTRIAQPAFTAGGNNVFGYYNGTGALDWNTTNLINIRSPNAANNAQVDGMTCPLNMATTTSVTSIRELSNCVLRIGQFNPLIAVDMVNGMYRPDIPPSNAFPQSTAAIASCISRMSRMLTVAGDAALRATRFPMNLLFNPAAARNLSAGNVNVATAWQALYDGINKMLDTQTGGAMTYLGSWFSDYNPVYWATLNAIAPVVAAIGRVPSFYMRFADIDWQAYSTDMSKTMLFGEYDAAHFGFPNVDNQYERILTIAPKQSTKLSPYDIMSRLSPMFPANINREPLAMIMMTKGGANVTQLIFPNMYPSVGRSPGITLQNYGILSYVRASLVDPPVDGTLPVYNPAINNVIYPGFYGNSVGYYTRAPQVKYNKHEVAESDVINYTIMSSDGDGTVISSILTELSGGSGK